ncbi:MAG: hypothetical protein RLZZ312_666 [Bacteroidota bacterium]|jgi:uncharacterized protein with HEPN domain
MEIKIQKLLTDVLLCIKSIEQYIQLNENFESYENNLMLQDAVERNIITIGEAINSLLKIDSETMITSARRIVDARNKLTHGYDEIEPLQIWSIIVKH